MNRNIYANPHVHATGHQIPQQRQAQPMNQLPQHIQYLNTPYGMQYVDVTTNTVIPQHQLQAYVAQQMQQMQMQQQQFMPATQMMPNQQQMMLMHNQRVQQQPQYQTGVQMHGQARLMGPGLHTFQQDLGTDVPDNRFDGPARPLIQRPNQQQQEVSQMRVPSNQANSTVIVQQKKLVPGKKLLKSKNASFLPRARPFEAREIETISMNVVNCGGLSTVIEELYERAYTEFDKTKSVIIAKCLLVENFYDTSLRGMTEELFQEDIESVYRYLRQAVDSLTTRADIVFMSEYNQWLTDQVNEILSVIYPINVTIDSFIEDFNDLKRHLGDNRTPDESLETVYKELCKRLRYMMIRCIEQHKAEEVPENHGNALYLVEQANIVYIKLLSTEIWPDGVPEDDPQGNRLVSSLTDHQSNDTFYVLTMDKIIYKVSVDLNKVAKVDIIGN